MSEIQIYSVNPEMLQVKDGQNDRRSMKVVMKTEGERWRKGKMKADMCYCCYIKQDEGNHTLLSLDQSHLLETWTLQYTSC